MSYISHVQEQVSNPLFDTIKLSLYPNHQGKTNLGEISLTRLFQMISTPYEEEIQEDLEWSMKELNSEGDPKEKKQALNTTKLKIPAVALHGIFSPGQKADDKLVTPSGLIFIDIDFKFTGEDPERIKELLFSRPEVIACWSSLSKMGVAGIAALDNIPTDSKNFQEYHKQYLDTLAQDLELPRGWFDNKVGKFHMACTIPYDPNLLVKSNFNSFYLEYAESSSLKNIKEHTKVFLTLLDSASLYKRDSEDFMYELEIETYPQHFPEGRPFFKCYMPYDKENGSRKAFNGNRNTILSSFLNNLVILNPNKTQEDFIREMMWINKSYCVPELPPKEIYKMVANKLRTRDRLKPTGVKLKKWWTDPRTPNRRKALEQLRKETSENKVVEFFMCEFHKLTHKVTTNWIAKICQMAPRTLEVYLTPEMRNDIKTHNAKFIKQRKRTKKESPNQAM